MMLNANTCKVLTVAAIGLAMTVPVLSTPLPALASDDARVSGRHYDRAGRHDNRRTDHHDRDRHDRHDRRAEKHRRDHDRHHRRNDRHRSDHRWQSSYDYGSHARGHRLGWRFAGHRHHRRHNLGRDLAIGLSLGVLTHQFTHQLSRRDRAPDRVVVVPAPSHGTRYSAQEAGWYESDARDAFPAGCMQVREYQTVVIIGGEEKDAYGQACLMPDGNWIQGPPTVEPEFN